MRRLLYVLALAAACGGETVVAPDAVTFAGSYTLQSINGQSLPYVVLQQGANSITLTDDHLTMSDGGTWSETSNYRIVSNGVAANQTDASAGTWLRSGTSLLLVSGATNGTAYTGSFTANRITLTNSVGTQVFAK